jgi:hypothetical protein
MPDSSELMEDVGLPTGATPDADNPGWFSWGDFPRGSFAAATGPQLLIHERRVGTNSGVNHSEKLLS